MPRFRRFQRCRFEISDNQAVLTQRDKDDILRILIGNNYVPIFMMQTSRNLSCPEAIDTNNGLLSSTLSAPG